MDRPFSLRNLELPLRIRVAYAGQSLPDWRTRNRRCSAQLAHGGSRGRLRERVVAVHCHLGKVDGKPIRRRATPWLGPTQSACVELPLVSPRPPGGFREHGPTVPPACGGRPGDNCRALALAVEVEGVWDSFGSLHHARRSLFGYFIVSPDRLTASLAESPSLRHYALWRLGR